VYARSSYVIFLRTLSAGSIASLDANNIAEKQGR